MIYSKNKENNIYITLSEASKISGISRDYLNVLIHRGKLRAVKIGKNWLTTKAWISECKMPNHLEQNQGSEYLSLFNAAKIANVSSGYLNVAVRRGKLRAVKLGRNWFTTSEWLGEYQKLVGRGITQQATYNRQQEVDSEVFSKVEEIKQEEKNELRNFKSSLILEREKALEIKSLFPEIKISSRELKVEEKENILEATKKHFKAIDSKGLEIASRNFGILKSLRRQRGLRFVFAFGLTVILFVAVISFTGFNILTFKDLNISAENLRASIFSDVLKINPNDLPAFSKWLADSAGKSLTLLKSKSSSELVVKSLEYGKSKIIAPQEVLTPIDTLADAEALDSISESLAEETNKITSGGGSTALTTGGDFTLIENRLSSVETRLGEQLKLTNSELNLQKKTILGVLETMLGIARFVPSYPISTIVVQGQPATLTTYSVAPQVQTGFDRLSATYLKLTSDAVINGHLTVKSGGDFDALSVSGASILTGNVTIGGTLNVASDATLNNLTLNGTLNLPGTATLGNASSTYLTVSSAAWLNRLKVTGTATTTFNSPITSFSGNFIVAADSANNVLLNPYGGNVGIGTTSPNNLLTIAGATTPSLGLTTNSGLSGWTIGIDTADANKFKIASSTAVGTNARLTIDGNGNFGIGTTSPGFLLSVNSTGNAYIGGDLTVSGAVNFQNSAAFSNGFNLTGIFTQTASSTSSIISSIASSTATHYSFDARGAGPIFNILKNNSSKFYIDNSGNVGIATTTFPASPFSYGFNIATSTFVYGNQFISGGLGVGIATTTGGAIQTSGDIFAGRNLYVTGNSTVLGNSTTIGASSANTLTINASVNSNLIPDINAARNLGSTSFYWNNAYINTLTANNISAASTSIAGTQSSTFTINSDNASVDSETETLIFFRGTVVPNALLTWNSATSSKRFEFNQALYINNGSASTTNPTLTVQTIANQTANGLQVIDNNSNNLFSVNPVGSNTTMINASSTYLTVSNTLFGGNLLVGSATTTGLSVNGGTLLNSLSAGAATTTSLSVTGGLNAGSFNINGQNFVVLNNGNASTTQLTVSGSSSLGGSLTVDGLTSLQNATTTGLTVNGGTSLGSLSALNTYINGNLGIASTSPNASLAVNVSNSATPTVAFNITSATSSLLFVTSAGQVGIGGSSFSDNGVQLLVNGNAKFTNATSTNGLSVSGGTQLNSLAFTNATGTSLSITGGTSFGSLNVTNLSALGNVTMGNATTTGLTVNGGIKGGSLDIASGGLFYSGGNVGIGTTNPGSKLELNTGAASIKGITIQAVASQTATGLEIKDSGGTVRSQLNPFQDTSVAPANIFDSSNDLNNMGHIIASFRVAGTEKVAIATNGLSIQGSSSLQNNGGQVTFTRGNASYLMSLTNTGGPALVVPSGNVGIASTSPSAVLSVNVSNSTGNTAALNITSATSSLLYVRSDGNIGVGTTTPITTLAVNGNGYFGGALGVGILNTTANTFRVGQCVTGDTRLRRRRKRKRNLELGIWNLDDENQKTSQSEAFGDSTEQGISEFATCNAIISNPQNLSSTFVDNFKTLRTLDLEGVEPSGSKWQIQMPQPSRPRVITSYQKQDSVSMIDNDDDYIYDEPMIVDIQPGDEVLSLNEKTATLEWQPVLALYDMGEKPIYKITTQLGKTIRTTSNHPYLTRYGWIPVGDLREGDEIALPICETLTKVAGVRLGSAEHFGNKNVATLPIKNYAVVANAIAIFFAAAIGKLIREMKRIILGKVELQFLNNPSLYISRQFTQVAPSMFGEGIIHGDFYRPSDFSIAREDTRPECRDNSISFQNRGLAYSILSSKSSSEEIKRSATAAGARSEFPLTFFNFLAKVFVFIYAYITNVLISLSNIRISAERDQIFFDRITSIDYCGIERVWDISVANTHNFVGNSIIAHNTAFIVDSSGNVGIGTTTPQNQLVVSSTINSGQTTPGLVLNAAYGSGSSVNGLAFRINSNSVNAAMIANPTNGTDGQLAFYTSPNLTTTNATERMRIDSSGNVGIGSTTPNAKLSILSNSSTDINNIAFGDSGGQGYLAAGTNYVGIADKTGTNRFAISQSTGNVGIGTTGPNGKLDVRQTTTGIDVIYSQRQTDSGGGSGNFINFKDATGGTTQFSVNTVGGITGNRLTLNPSTGGTGYVIDAGDVTTIQNAQGYRFRQYTTTGGAIPIFSIEPTLAGGGTYTSFLVNSTDTSAGANSKLIDLQSGGTSRFTVLNTGNVGIGTTSPAALFEVAGATPAIRLTANSVVKDTILLQSSTGLVNTAKITAYDYVAATGRTLHLQTDNNNLIIGENGGNVGIASTSPSAVLSVNVSNSTGNTAALNITSATSSLLYVRSDGNIGVGTTTPITTFAVNGNGYFGGALGVGILNTTANTFRVGQCVTGDTRLRRRRKKKNYRGSTSIDDYIYDEPMIVDIQPGDEVLSLNEKTGELVWRKVKQLAYMGIKPIYKLTTASGKIIRTTGNHPYLARTDHIGLLKSFWATLCGVFVFINQKAAETATFGVLDMIRKSGLAPACSISNQKSLSRVIVDNIVSQLGVGPAGNRTPETLVLTQETYHTGPNARILYQENNIATTVNGYWTKVVDLKEGMEIAVTGENNKSSWDKIISIEYLPEEDVYDIEIEETHNFVANGIIAHNTAFIVDSSGNVGIGTTTPGQLLSVNGNGYFAGNLNVASSTTLLNASTTNLTVSASTFLGNATTTGLSVNGGTLLNSLSFGAATGTSLTVTGGSSFAGASFSGNVGIGTAAPSTLVELSSSSAETALTISDYNTSPNPTIYLRQAQGTASSPLQTNSNYPNLGIINFQGYQSGFYTAAQIIGKASGDPNASSKPGRLEFYTVPSGSTSLTERMRITDTGLVGIGTTISMIATPSHRLEVADSANAYAGTQTDLLAIDIATGGTIPTIGTGGSILFRAQRAGDIMVSQARMGAVWTDPNLATLSSALTFGTLTGGGSITERMRIDGSGNVGIGTTSPTQLLAVNGSAQIGSAVTHSLSVGATQPTTNTLNQIFAGGNGIFMGQNQANGETDIGNNFYYNNGFLYRFTAAASRIGFSDATAGDIDFLTAPSGTAGSAITWANRMTIQNSTGNVGIGTTTPNEKLSIGGSNVKAIIGDSTTHTALYSSFNSQVWNGLEIYKNGGSTNGAGILSFVENDTYTAGAGFGNIMWSNKAIGTEGIDNLRVASLSAAMDGANNKASINFYTLGATFAERMRINSSGYVGIGTTTPIVPLDVEGTGTIVGGTGDTIALFTATGDSSTNTWVAIGSKPNSNSGLRLLNGLTTKWIIENDGGSTWNTNALVFYDLANAVPRMTITSAGLVGIGTTSPGQLLSVNGNGYFAGNLNIASSTTLLNASTTNLTVSAATFLGNATTTGLSVNGGTLLNSLSFGAATGTSLTVTGGSSFAGASFSGNVGIGTAAPQQLLHIYGSGATQRIESSAASFAMTEYKVLNRGVWDVGNSQGTASAFEIRKDGSTKLLIDSNGNVGIASTSPSAVLSVNVSGATGDTAAFNITNATGSLLFVRSDGSVGVGTTTPGLGINKFKFVVQGNASFAGCVGFNAAANSGTCVDVAESYSISEPMEAGDIVMLDQNSAVHIKKAQATSGNLIIGAVSTNPSILINGYDTVFGGLSQSSNSGTAPVALAGRVPVKVSLENGPIAIGDRITISSISGVGMKVAATSTTSIVGMALEPFNGWTINPDGSQIFSQTGKVLVFVNLGQPQLAAAKGTGDLASMVTASGDLNMNGFSILNVKSIAGMNGLWKIDEGGNITAQSVNTQSLTVGGGAASGVTIYDRQTTAPKCIYIEGGVIKTSDGACGATTNAGSSAVIETASASATATTATTATTSTSTIATATTTPTVSSTPTIATSTVTVIVSTVSTSSPQVTTMSTATTTP